METLFCQDNFLGGLNSRLEASKIGQSEYPLLFNGRVTANTIRPTKEHLLLDTPLGTKRQGLYAIGRMLVLFSDGNAYWKDTADENSNWQLIPAWTPLSSTADRIYAEPIPVNYFQGSISYDAGSPDLSQVRATYIPGIPAQTKSLLFVTDGVNQPRTIAGDGTFSITGTYVSWTTTSPNYVPICKLPKKSGGKLYVIDAITGTRIFHSVSGRFTDFVINRNPTGDKGGDATTTCKSVDYNEVTALFPIANSTTTGGLLVSTLYSSYAITPDYTDTFFGEPKLPDSFLFPTGAVNERSFADLNGDLAFITQLGIQSFNATQQARIESNNFPVGAKIANLLIDPQTGSTFVQSNTCAINFGTEALFSLRTVYGYAVIVYDTILQTFVSIDLGFGEVTDFAVTKWNGIQKLFFLTKDGNVYQAYGDSKYAVCRVYLGEYAPVDPEQGKQAAGVQHKVAGLRLQFANVKEDASIQLGVYADRKLLNLSGDGALPPSYSQTRSITADTYPEISPYSLPFPSHKQAYPVDFILQNSPYCWKTGVLLEWNGGAELLSITVEGETRATDSWQKVIVTESPNKVITFFNDNAFGTELAGSGSWETVSVTKNSWYSVIGTANLGNRTVSDAIFQAASDKVFVNGSLTACGDLKSVWDLMVALKPDKIIGLGDHAMSSGTADEVKRILTVVDKSKLIWTPGNHDLVTSGGLEFFKALPSIRYDKFTIGPIEIFLLDSDASCPDGISASSVQGQWLQAALENSTATFKIVGLHHPPYTDVDSYSPGYPTLRWPFKRWGADLVVSGHSHAYERFDVDGLPYVVNSASGSTVRGFKVGQNNSVVRYSLAGYTRIRSDNYKLLVEFVDVNGNIKDSFGIYA